MSLRQKPFYTLDCDQCGASFCNPENDGPYINESGAELGLWAVQSGWLVYFGRFYCAEDCAPPLKAGPHHYLTTAGETGFCIICKEWADDPRHTNVQIAGQLALIPEETS